MFDSFQRRVGAVIPFRYDAIAFAINLKSQRHFELRFILTGFTRARMRERKEYGINQSKTGLFIDS